MEKDKKKLTDEEILEIKLDIARRWKDPTKRIEDIFNIRNPRGELSKVIVPEPQKQIIRDGILGKARQQIMQGISYITVIDKGRQMGFSVFNAYEAVLIAEDFPDSNIYYVATEIGQARDWMQKMNQLIVDSNHWPEELGGGPMLNITDIKKIEVKVINNTFIVGLSANPSAIRGKTGIAVYFDEAAWALRTKDIARETWKALSYIISQGGQGRIQSTPRTSDDQEFFWGIYQKALQKKGGMVAYECPVIENWKDLDLTEPLYIELNNKQREIMQYEQFSIEEKQELINKYKDNPGFEVTDDYIRQPAKVLYPWKNLQELENDREKDYQQFMQEYLCQPIDETLKMIQSEWIETNISSDGQYLDRGNSTNSFQMVCDFAQKNDVTAIVITEKIITKDKAIFHQRYVEQTQMEYPEQAKHITKLYAKFRPEYVSIDATGPGIPISQFLKKEFRDNGFNPTVIKDVTFTTQNKEQMATGFKALCQPNPSIVEFIEMEDIDEDGKYTMKKVPIIKSSYRFLRDKGNKDHIEMIQHIKRVEKEVLPQNVRYSGKKYGRDDFFWAASQLCLYETVNSQPKAAFGKTSQFSTKITNSYEQKTKGQQHIFNVNKKRWETRLESKDEQKRQFQKQKSLLEQHNYRKSLKFAYGCLRNSKNICQTRKCIVNPIECTNPDDCRNDNCSSYKYVKEISERYHVTIDDLYRLFTKIYK